MKVGRLVGPLVFLCSGFVLGAIWSPLGRPGHGARGDRSLADVQTENKKFIAQMRAKFGVEAAEFARQFEDMTFGVKQYPFDAHASSDGRFVIRLFGSDETMASDLRYPEIGGAVKERVRHYSFSSGGRTYSVDFARGLEKPNVTESQFRITDAEGHDLVSYVDSDGDGRWDRFADYTSGSPQFFRRDGLCWKERVKDATKRP